MKYHLLNDFGIYKSALKASFYRWYWDRISTEKDLRAINELLNLKTQEYTLDEIEMLLSVYASAHHECVDENPDDYTTRRGSPSIEVYNARRVLDREAELVNRVAELRALESKEIM